MMKNKMFSIALAVFILCFHMLFCAEAVLSVESERQAIIDFWQEEKAPFTLRERLKKQEEKRVKGILKEEEEIRWVDGEILVCIQRGYSLVKGAYTEKDFSEIQFDSFFNLTENQKGVQEKKITKEQEPDYQILHFRLKDKSQESVVFACEMLRTREDVYSANPNYIFRGENTSVSDPCYKGGWHNNGTPEEDSDDYYVENKISYETVFAEEAWNITRGSSDVTVAVLDSGVRLHPDLADAIVTGYDAQYEDEITTDAYNEHGTCVAGIIAAKANDQYIRGIAPNIKIFPVQYARIYYNDGSFDFDVFALVRAFKKIEDNGIMIANMSQKIAKSKVEETLFGEEVPEIRKSINNYLNAGGLLVCSAGNDCLDVDDNERYPAWFDHPNMICVANLNAFSSDMSLAADSNFGESLVDIAAPGVNIISTSGVDGWSFVSGTSYASPMVAGAAALLKSVYPSMTAGQIKARLLSTATYSAALDGRVACGGYLNIGRALSLADPAYETKFSRGYSDTFGTMSLWENKAGIYNSSDADISVGGGTVVFENNSVFHFPQTTPHEYHYRRLSSRWVTEDRLGTEGVAGVTIDLKLKLDMIPIHENVTAQTAKYGQTGFIINTHMDSSNQEFYLCIAQKQTADGVRVVVTSFSGNRHQIDSIAPQEIILNIPDIDDEFQRFTFSFDASSRKINVYYNGEPVGQFNKPMKRISPSISQDFVCFSLVNRMELNGIIGEDVGYSYSRAELDYLRIYNQTVYPEDIWLMRTT